MNNPDVLVIGGGISGLSSAWWLAQQGIAVEVWEAGPTAGGKIHTHHQDGYVTEQAAGLLMNFRPEIDRLIAATGLSNLKRSGGIGVRRYVVKQRQLLEVPMRVPAMMRSPIWSWTCKLRLMTEILVPKGGGERETVTEFITRRFGHEILETAMAPYICGTLGSDPDLANAHTVLPRLTALEQRYGSLTLGMLMNRVLRRRRANVAESFSFSGGMSQMVNTLTRAPGVRLRTNFRVSAVRPVADAWQITARAPDAEITRSVRHLVFSTPANITAELLAPVDASLMELLQGISYAPLAVVHLGMDRRQVKHPLDGTGFLVPGKDGMVLNGNLWMSSLFPERAPQDKVLLTSYAGGARYPERAAWADDRLTDCVLSDLARLIGVTGSPEYVRVDRHAQALPLYHGHYAERLHAIEARLSRWPGLYLNANFQGGVSVRERIFMGLQTATKIAGACRRETAADIFRQQGIITAQ